MSPVAMTVPVPGLYGYRSIARRRCLRYLAAALLFCLACTSHLTGQTKVNCDAARAFASVDKLLQASRYAEARAILKQINGCPNLTPRSKFQIGWLFGRSHDFKTANTIFRSLPSNVPDPVTHQYAIALSAFESGDYSETVEGLKHLQTQGRLDSKCANLLGVSYSKLGRYQDAYNTLEENIALNPSDLSSYLNLITLFADAGRFSDAESVASQAVSMFPQNSEVIIARGAAHTLQGELDQAEGDFAGAVRLAPRDPVTRFFLALSEYRKGDYDRASSEITSALQAGVSDSDLHYLLAECLLKTDPGTSQPAIAQLDQAISLNHKGVAALTLRGKLLLENGKVNQALPDLIRAHRLDPSSRSATYNLARAQQRAGRTAGAKILFKKLQSQNGDSLAELSDHKLHKALNPESSR